MASPYKMHWNILWTILWNTCLNGPLGHPVERNGISLSGCNQAVNDLMILLPKVEKKCQNTLEAPGNRIRERWRADKSIEMRKAPID